jgi:hypothetical protein
VEVIRAQIKDKGKTRNTAARKKMRALAMVDHPEHFNSNYVAIDTFVLMAQ